MDDWEKFNETSLPEEENFVVTKIWNYVHAKYVCKEFQIFVYSKQYIIVG